MNVNDNKNILTQENKWTPICQLESVIIRQICGLLRNQFILLQG